MGRIYELADDEAEVLRQSIAKLSAEGVLRRPLYERLDAALTAPVGTVGLRTVTLNVAFQTDAPPEHVARIVGAAVVQIAEGAFYDEADHGNEVTVPTWAVTTTMTDPATVAESEPKENRT